MSSNRLKATYLLVILAVSSFGGGCCCLDYCCDGGSCGARRGCGQGAVAGVLWGSGDGSQCANCGTDAPGCVAGGCGYPVSPRRPFRRLAAASGWCPDYPAIEAGWVPCRGPIVSFFAGVRDIFANASCGCGGYYIDEWYSDPPACHDPCTETCGTNGGISYQPSGYPSAGPGAVSSGCGCDGGTAQVQRRAHNTNRPEPSYAAAHRSPNPSPRQPTPPQRRVTRTNPHAQTTTAVANRRPPTRSKARVDDESIEPVAYDEQ